MEPAGVYVHVPFCMTKCGYCGFYSQTDLQLQKAWLDAIEKEAGFYSCRLGCCDTLYLGGGTPSVLDADPLARLIQKLRSIFDLTAKCETTLEANPADLTPDKLGLVQNLGVNRLSVGVQSFDDSVLHFLNRRHSAVEAEEALDRIRSVDGINLGLDLIFGLPGQSVADWLATLKKALRFFPEHLSCYQLTLEPNTPFAERKARGELSELSEDEQADLFVATSEFLLENGYVHYEISNFARGDQFRSRHNQKYWHHVPTLGLGPSAHSYGDRTRWWNHRGIGQYLQSLRSGSSALAGQERLSEEQFYLETLFLGLRTKEGVPWSSIKNQTRLMPRINHLVEEGFLVPDANGLRPTLKGFLVADRIPLMLL